MAPNLTQEQIDELQSRGLLSSGISDTMRKYTEERAAKVAADRDQMMQELGATPKPILDKVLTDLSQSREQDDAYAIPAKIAMDAAKNPELGDIVERTNEKLQEIKGGRVQMSPPGAGNVVLNTPIADRKIEMYPGEQVPVGDGVPAPVDRISNPAVLPPPAQEKSLVAEKSPAQQAGQMQLDALEMKERAAMMRAGQEQKDGNAKAGLFDSTASSLAKIENSRLLERADLDKRRNEQLNKVEQVQSQYDTMQIDPNHFYGSRTTEQNVLLNLGLALSVFGGNTKEYTDNIYKAIDRDIDVQKEQIKLQGNKVTGARNVLSDMMDVTQDVDKAADLAKAGMLKQAELKGAAMAARVSNADAKAKLLDTVADLNMKRAEILSKVNSVESIDQQLAAKSVMGGPQVLTEDMVKSVLKSDPKKAAFIIPGVGIATDEITKRDVATKVSAAKILMGKYAELRALREEQSKPGSVLPSAKANRGKILAADIMLEGKKVAGLGVLNEKDYALMESILPLDPLRVQYNPADLVSFGIQRVSGDPLLDRLEALEKRTRDGLSSNLENTMVGLTPEFYEKMIAPGRGSNLRSKLKEVETPKALK